MCVVCTPDKHVNDFLTTKSKHFTNGKVILALNVGQDLESQSVFIADGVKGGNHWTVLAYYGDSLSWDIPCNLTHMVEPLLSKLGIELKFYDVKPMQSNMKRELINLYPFYPTQACSNVCGVIVIVLCMAAIMCCNWQTWHSWKDKMPPQCLAKPSIYSAELRLSVISWIIEGKINTDIIIQDFKQLQEPQPLQNHEICTSQSESDNESESDNYYSTDDTSPHEKYIAAILPGKYTYKFTEVDYCNIHTHNFKCSLKIKLRNEEEARKWVQEYNSATQETMVFQRSKNQLGKRVCKKLYLQCHHYQRNRAMSNICLKTTHRLHNTKNRNCPAQIIITMLAPHQRHQGYLIEAMLQHT